MTSSDELVEIADRLAATAASTEYSAAEELLSKLEAVSNDVGRAFSGSWLGYHACVYYNELQPPPPGVHFSKEWGLKDMSVTSLGSRGEWKEYDPEELTENLRERAGNPDLSSVATASATAAEVFGDARQKLNQSF